MEAAAVSAGGSTMAESPIFFLPSADAAGDYDNCTAEFTKLMVSMRLLVNMPLSLFGMITNTINIVVFLDPEMRVQLVNHFLLALSVSDLLLLVFNFFMLIFPVIATMSTSVVLHDVFPLFLWYSYPLALTTQTCGVYLTVLVSVHRYLGVCHPFRAKRWVSSQPVRLAIASSVFFSVLINIPSWLELDITHCLSHDFQTVLRTMTLTPLKKSPLYLLIQKAILYTLIMFAVPFVTLIIVNCRIIFALRESSHLRSMHSSARLESRSRMLQQFRLLKASKYSEIFNTFTRLSSNNMLRTPPQMKSSTGSGSGGGGGVGASTLRDRSVTLMLLAIVAIFLLCNCLPFANNIIESYFHFFPSSAPILITEDVVSFSSSADVIIDASSPLSDAPAPSSSLPTSLFDISCELGNVLISLNSASSLFVYLIFSSKYRAIIKHWLGLERRTRVNGVALTTAMAAQKALELSMLPDEVDARGRLRAVRQVRARTMITTRVARPLAPVRADSQPESGASELADEVIIEDARGEGGGGDKKSGGGGGGGLPFKRQYDLEDARRTSSKRKLLRFATVD